MVVKGGSNAVHGSVFEFLRNYKLNTRSFFARTDDGLKRNQYGGAVGGRGVKDKTFFFFSYQGTNTRQRPSNLISIVPTPVQRPGHLSGLAPVKEPRNNNPPFPRHPNPANPHEPARQ